MLASGRIDGRSTSNRPNRRPWPNARAEASRSTTTAATARDRIWAAYAIGYARHVRYAGCVGCAGYVGYGGNVRYVGYVGCVWVRLLVDWGAPAMIGGMSTSRAASLLVSLALAGLVLAFQPAVGADEAPAAQAASAPANL